MELHFKTPIDRAYDAIEDALRRGAESWLPEADLKDGELTAELTGCASAWAACSDSDTG
ncbi:MAG: hypothetical protein M3072_11885 [Candidatus Dormibacteraeota bacterium]|nr:hypothetical protein [Candidatus Dormibacteraeota bacterium]